MIPPIPARQHHPWDRTCRRVSARAQPPGQGQVY